MMFRKVCWLCFIFTFLTTISPYSRFNLSSGNNPFSFEKGKDVLFREYVRLIYLKLNDNALNYDALENAMKGYFCLKSTINFKRDSILTIIDFAKPSCEDRLFVIDLHNYTVIQKCLVAHGRNSGNIYAEKFSNKHGSNQSSIGFFITAETYNGSRGFSLKIDGLEECNNKVRERGIVFHAADYVNRDWALKTNRIGRSNGCPSVQRELNEKVISLIKDGSCLFVYSTDKNYFSQSVILRNYNYEFFDKWYSAF